MDLPEEPALELDRPAAVAAVAAATTTGMVVICRVCLSTRQHMISIHSTVPEYDQKTLYAMLLSVCRPLNEREKVPGLPEQICRNCKWKLLSAYDLYETTLASDDQLRQGVLDVQDERTGNDGPLPSEVVTTSLKRPFSSMVDNQQLEQTGKKINLDRVKKEIPDDAFEDSLSESKINETTDTLDDAAVDTTIEGDAEDRTDQSFAGGVDESKDDPNQESLEAFFEEHYELDTTTNNHVCGLCKQEFAYKSQCRMHIIQKHNPAKPFKCEVCFCTLTSHHRLVRHNIMTHGVGQIKQGDVIKSPHGSNGEVTYTCPICRKVFNSNVRFKRHKNVHVAHNRPFKCDVCLYRFATRPQLTQHAKVHESKSPSTGESPGPDTTSGWYGCDRCEEMFPGKRARTMHMKKVHQVYQMPSSGGQRSDDREKTDYTCIICNKSFERETVLNTHMKMHELLAAEKEKEKRLDLEKLVKQELQQQMKLNVPPLPPLSPEIVDKSNHVLEPFVLGLVPVAKAGTTTNSSNTNNNSATSVNNNSDTTSAGPSAVIPQQEEAPKSDIAFMCIICEKEFDKRELLKKHQKDAHPKLNVDIVSPKMGRGNVGGNKVPGRSMKPFLPRLTAKPGLNVRLLNGSVKQSSKSSTETSMEYTGDSESLDHENDSSNMQPGADNGSQGDKLTPLRCELCHKTFSYKCYLSMHMRKNHDKSKPYACKVCHYRFGYRGTLQKHQLIHSSQNVQPGGHGSIIFKCRICSAKFLELKQLNIHLKSHRKPTDDPNRKVQLIQCQECSQIFSDRTQYRQHMEDEHDQEMLVDREPRSSHHPNDGDEFHPERLLSEQGRLVGSSSSLRLGGRSSASSLADLKLQPELRDEEAESFLNDLSIIKVESNFE
ncbi:zinc finger protein 808-like [Anopheles coustani]|uniref:zinc finger protein 808-like n=2 Tax=coustani group TaxID=59130 RepID=UPI002657DFBE|nr:zinc finger protein 808-like [Anopheles coustani]XP_058117017.1 zinc finger protein 808-like [Anopheles coustani]